MLLYLYKCIQQFCDEVLHQKFKEGRWLDVDVLFGWGLFITALDWTVLIKTSLTYMTAKFCPCKKIRNVLVQGRSAKGKKNKSFIEKKKKKKDKNLMRSSTRIVPHDRYRKWLVLSLLSDSSPFCWSVCKEHAPHELYTLCPLTTRCVPCISHPAGLCLPPPLFFFLTVFDFWGGVV